MKVTREQAAANREKVLQAAGRLFRKHGFEGIGLADIMKAAGLTHGGFYGHFDSKHDLAAEACERALDASRKSWIEGSPGADLETAVRKYLTPRHRSDPGRGCLFAALGSEVARQPRNVRHAFTEGLRSTIHAIAELLPGPSAASRREQAVATMAGLVGAMILSRAVDDAQFSDEILEAAAAVFSRTN
jgi:TetR/AcrR family transcriptional regulator, transcriptional repressor for nem operon